jgi:hypothetical protein
MKLQTPIIQENIRKNIIGLYISSVLGCGCGCAGHTTYFLVKENDCLYEYIYNAYMEVESSSEYYYDNSKPIIKQILILSFKEFYDAFDIDDQKILKIIDNYWSNTISNKKYYDVYHYDKTNFEFNLDLNKCLKCYEKYCANLKYEIKKYNQQEVLDLIDFNLEKNNLDIAIYLINEEMSNTHDENKNYSYYF